VVALPCTEFSAKMIAKEMNGDVITIKKSAGLLFFNRV
jgi:hypothetical protein